MMFRPKNKNLIVFFFQKKRQMTAGRWWVVPPISLLGRGIRYYWISSICLSVAAIHQKNPNTRCAWAGGNLFPVVLLCQFLVLAGNRFWFTYLCT
jgi:hypothetical protein